MPFFPQNSSFRFLALSNVSEATEQLEAMDLADVDRTSSSSTSLRGIGKPATLLETVNKQIYLLLP